MSTEQRPYPDTNQVAIVGKLTKNPILKTVGDKQTPVAELTVHVNNSSGQPTRIDIQIWAGGANAAHEYLNKGDQIVVTGKLRTHQYTNRDGKQTHVYIDAGTNGLQFTSQRPDQTRNNRVSNDGQGDASRSQPTPQAAAHPHPSF